MLSVWPSPAQVAGGWRSGDDELHDDQRSVESIFDGVLTINFDTFLFRVLKKIACFVLDKIFQTL